MKKLMACLLMIFGLVVSFGMERHAEAYSGKQYCFIGDSRFVGMQYALNSETDENITWLAKEGAGNRWFWQVEDTIGTLDRDTIIIYEMGVNDLDADACVEVLQHLKNMGFEKVYFTGVTPVDEGTADKYGYSRTNYQIRAYNYEVFCNLPDGVEMMDCYDRMIDSRFDTEDGIHYTYNTYINWFNQIMSITPA